MMKKQAEDRAKAIEDLAKAQEREKQEIKDRKL